MVLLVALLAIIGYSAFSAFTLWSDLQSGRSHLKSGQLAVESGLSAGDVARLNSGGRDLADAHERFQAAESRSADDPAFRIAAGAPYLNDQVAATRKLASIGVHLSAAGQAVVPIGNGLVQFKQTYGQGGLTPEKLQAALSAAQALVARYQSSSRVVGSELKAAHDDRASVNTDRLAPPLKDAFAEVDSALVQADQTLGRYQDVNQLVRQLLGPVSALGS